jgi:glucokinase
MTGHAKSLKRSHWFVGIDIGGTKTLAVLTDGDRKVHDCIVTQTRVCGGPTSVVEDVFSKATALAAKVGLGSGELDGLAVAFAGLCDLRSGVILEAPNLLGWIDYPLYETLRSKCDIPIVVANDVDMAALAEFRDGAGKNTLSMLFVSVGTGIGGGLVLKGSLYQGGSGLAGEFGHMVISSDSILCACGRTGCLEAMASGGALEARTRERILRGEHSALTQLVGGKIDKITARLIFDAAENQDPLANSIIDSGAKALGIGLTNLLHIFNPELIVIGGGMAAQWERYVKLALKEMNARAFPSYLRGVTVSRSMLGGAASALGGIALLQEQAPV